MAICIVERWKKIMSYRFVPEWTALFIFFFFSPCHICRATLCWDPEILLLWERDATTSLYCPLVLWLVEVTILQKRSSERGSNVSVLQRTLDARGKIYNHQANSENSYSNASIDVCIPSGHRGRFSPLKCLCNINDKHNCHEDSCLPIDDSFTVAKKEGRGGEGRGLVDNKTDGKTRTFFSINLRRAVS